MVGLAFAFGWTPCIGPILGAILLYASQQETVGQGVVLLSAYSAGLGIPFLLAALAVNWFFKASGGLRRWMRAVEVASGALLIGVGLLLVTDRLTLIAQWFSKVFPGPGHDRLDRRGPRYHADPLLRRVRGGLVAVAAAWPWPAGRRRSSRRSSRPRPSICPT